MKYSKEFQKYWVSLLGLKPSETAKPLVYLGWTAALKFAKEKRQRAKKRRQKQNGVNPFYWDHY